MKEIKIICFPFAGGTKFSYRQFEKRAPGELRLHTMELSGRGTRAEGPLPSSIDEVVEDLYPRMVNITQEKEYALFGHSMGALVAFEMARKIVRAGGRLPLHLFVTGAEAPSSPERTRYKKYLLGKDAFVAELVRYGGCPPAIFEDPEVLDFLLPVIRSDFEATETYQYVNGKPLPIPLTVITGTEEDLKQSEIIRWKDESTYAVDFRSMHGNHFFVNTHVDAILNIIQSKCLVNAISTI